MTVIYLFTSFIYRRLDVHACHACTYYNINKTLNYAFPDGFIYHFNKKVQEGVMNVKYFL